MYNKVLIVDNYDSFTWNLYQYFSYLGATVEVRRHDTLSILDVERLAPDRLVISPGPGSPNDSGISLSVVCNFADKIPILGICLGHQVIAQVFGGKVIRAHHVMHGKRSVVYHDGLGVFFCVPQFLKVIRYHSLVVDRLSLPVCLKITSWSLGGGNKLDEVMGIRHGSFPIEGVQFHPESVLSEYGYQILINFMNL